MTSGRGAAEIREILDVLDGDAYLPQAVLSLAAWVAEYYACGPGEAVAAAVPPFAWVESRRVVALSEEGRRRASGGEAESLGPGQRATVEALVAAGSVPVSTLRTRLRKGPAARAPRADRVGACARSNGRAGSASSQVLDGERVTYKTERVVELTAQGLDVAQALAAGASTIRLGPRQRELLTALAAAPRGSEQRACVRWGWMWRGSATGPAGTRLDPPPADRAGSVRRPLGTHRERGSAGRRADGRADGRLRAALVAAAMRPPFTWRSCTA